MGTNNTERIIAQVSRHIKNINRLLKNIKSETVVDYIQLNNKDIIVTTNIVAASSDLNMVKKYIKHLNNINSNNIISLRLPQLKFYLKILDILYFVEDTNCQDHKKWTWFLSHFSIFFPIFFYFFLFLAFRVSDNIGHMVHRRVQKGDIISYANLMANTWLFRVGQKQLAWTMGIQYKRQTILCRVLYQVILCYPNIRLPLNPTLRALSYNTNLPITSDIIERIIQSNYIFNNLVLASHL